MSTLSLRLPDSLHEQLRELAQKEGISMNQFITLAVAEKMSALMAEEYIQQRASRASREKYDAVLSRVRDHAPEEYDAAFVDAKE
jgi:predicted transcriptional regulator